MKHYFLLLFFATIGCLSSCQAQESSKQSLTLQKEIALSNVKCKQMVLRGIS